MPPLSLLARLDYTTVVTFGDSNSDTGNAYRLSNGTWPPVPPFNSNGGFADGPLWNQMLSEQFFNNTTLKDFFYASATTDSRLVQGTMGRNPNLIANYNIRNRTQAPGVRQQIIQYMNSTINQTIDFDRTLFIISIGMNNYIFNRSLTPMETVQSLLDACNLLIIYGARHLVLFNQSPYERYPEFRDRTTTNMTKGLCLKHNEILAEKMDEMYFSLNTRLDIHLFDSYTVISNILNNYMVYGFENLDHCWDTESFSTVIIKCNNTSRRLFTDEYHLTTTMQLFIAKELYGFLAGLNTTSFAVRTLPMNVSSMSLFVAIVCLFI